MPVTKKDLAREELIPNQDFDMYLHVLSWGTISWERRTSTQELNELLPVI